MEAAPFTLLLGDVLEQLATLPDESVHCVVTSPPYWGLRDYGTASWNGGDPECDHTLEARHQAQGATSARAGRSNVEAQRNETFRDVCARCGATRVDQQLGLEATPELFVERMVGVFREVRRVLRSDGTCWLNIGDSYNTQQAGNTTPSGFSQTRPSRVSGNGDQETVKHGRGLVGNLKPKDLVGIPWALAKALRDPYYTGTIRDERDRIWLAAMIDAEGCIYVHRRKAGQSNGQGYERKHDTYGSGLEVSNTNRAIVERVLALAGRGSISEQTRGRNQTLYRWNLRTNECRDVLREVYPYLVAKQQQARIAIGCPSSGELATAAFEALKGLHAGSETTLDFPAPASMFEPGWYLRRDVIWNKPNPMPESATDRPTSAHEYVFLLTKSARYFYDGEAIKEQATDAGAARVLRGSKYDDPAVEEASPHRASRPRASKMRTVRPGIDTNGGGQGSGEMSYEVTARNKRSVWTIATEPYPDAHFATFPTKLVEPCILAGTSERGCCPVCGAPWERELEREDQGWDGSVYGARAVAATGGAVSGGTERSTLGSSNGALVGQQRTLGWQPTCVHGRPPVPCTVLDPFGGSGTTPLVARRHGRASIAIELNPEYAALMEKRLETWWRKPQHNRTEAPDDQLSLLPDVT